MVNRYYGNTGWVERVEEPAPLRRAQIRRELPPEPLPRRQPQAARPPAAPLGGVFDGLLDGIGGFVSRAAKRLETEDIILLVLLYLLYRESRDEEWLIIIGAMLFF